MLIKGYILDPNPRQRPFLNSKYTSPGNLSHLHYLQMDSLTPLEYSQSGYPVELRTCRVDLSAPPGKGLCQPETSTSAQTPTPLVSPASSGSWTFSLYLWPEQPFSKVYSSIQATESCTEGSLGEESNHRGQDLGLPEILHHQQQQWCQCVLF